MAMHRLFRVAVVLGVAFVSAPAALAVPRTVSTHSARQDLTRRYQLKRCHGTIHAGFTAAERRHASHYGRYKGISCVRARQIVRLVDQTNGPYPAGYFWETPHGDPSTWPTVFGHVLHAVYLAPDGFHGRKANPGVAVVIFG